MIVLLYVPAESPLLVRSPYTKLCPELNKDTSKLLRETSLMCKLNPELTKHDALRSVFGAAKWEVVSFKEAFVD